MKFKIGDKVWFIRQNRIKFGIVFAVRYINYGTDWDRNFPYTGDAADLFQKRFGYYEESYGISVLIVDNKDINNKTNQYRDNFELSVNELFASREELYAYLNGEEK